MRRLARNFSRGSGRDIQWRPDPLSDFPSEQFRLYSAKGADVMATKNEDEWGLAASATGPDYKELLGKLLVFKPTEFNKDVRTENGVKNALTADVYVIDEKAKKVTTHLRQTMIFPAVLVSQLKTSLGKFVPGRLQQGKVKTDADGKPMLDDSGKEYAPSWEIKDPTEIELLAARQAVQAFHAK